MIKKCWVLVSFVGLIGSGCAGMTPISDDKKRTFTYDYEVSSVGKEELWVRARDYFAETYEDSRSVLSVQDRNEATLIGKGAAGWRLFQGSKCFNNYKVRFQSKDGKARLRLELLQGVPAYSNCAAWPSPSPDGYQQIVRQFENLSSGLGKALKKQTDSGFEDF